VTLQVSGRTIAAVRAEPGRFQEVVIAVPHGVEPGRKEVSLLSEPPLTVLHYWSFGRVL
jgi:hypothetical protein